MLFSYLLHLEGVSHIGDVRPVSDVQKCCCLGKEEQSHGGSDGNLENKNLHLIVAKTVLSL